MVQPPVIDVNSAFHNLRLRCDIRRLHRDDHVRVRAKAKKKCEKKKKKSERKTLPAGHL